MTDKDGKHGTRLPGHRVWVSAVVMALLLALAGVIPAGE